jgi:hypothetical protein
MTQMAITLIYKYNNKIGVNERFKCIIKSKMEPAMVHKDYIIRKMSVYLV